MEHSEKQGTNTTDCVMVEKQRWAVRLIEKERMPSMLLYKAFDILPSVLANIIAFVFILDTKETNICMWTYSVQCMYLYCTHTYVYFLQCITSSLKKKSTEILVCFVLYKMYAAGNSDYFKCYHRYLIFSYIENFELQQFRKQ